MKDLIDRLNKFAETTTGKIVVVIVFLLLVGIIFFSVKGLLYPQTPATNSNEAQAPSQQAEQTKEATETTQQAYQEKDLSAVSQFSLETGFEVFSGDILRDPFKPLESFNRSESTQTTATTSTATQEKPITLLGVTYEDGQLKAVLGYEGNVVNAGPGDTVGSYMVVSVSKDSVRLLYGDQPIFLEIGQAYAP